MDFNKCHNNWCCDIKTVMSKLDLYSHFEKKTEVDMETVKSKVAEHYAKIWKSGVIKLSKLRPFVALKDNSTTEQYVQLNLSKHERSLYSLNLDVEILPLYIGTGRFISGSPERRLCTFCNYQKIEDDMHFLIQYSYYNHTRITILVNS